MMGHRETKKGGAEWDVFTPWRKVMHWRTGEVKAIKKAFTRRIRRSAGQRLQEAMVRGDAEDLEVA